MDLSCNQIDLVEFTPHQFPKLDYLNLSFNRLSYIPNLQVFPGLTQFLANDNKILTIDIVAFLHLEHLKVLDISNNSIKSLPNELGLLPHLNFLGVSGNLFKSPNQATIRKGTCAILSYLRAQVTEK